MLDELTKELYVAHLGKIERVLGEVEPTPETLEAFESAVLLVKQLKWHIRDGEPLDK